MTLSAVQGQPRAVRILTSALRAQQLSHALLFGGPAGVGKEAAAVGLAQALLCQQAPDEGCGACEVCDRVERRLHPDVTWVMPDAERVAREGGKVSGSGSRDLKVDQVRALQERLALRPLEGSRKIAILVSAESMNESAQNALLKTLEEPPSQTSLVLLATAPDRLLPTIRSRCARIPFSPLPTDTVAERIAEERKLDPGTARLVAELSGGSLSRARELDVRALEGRRELIESFEAVDQDLTALVAFAETHGASRATAEEAVDLLLLWNRDVLLAGVGVETIANRDLLPLAQSVAARISPAGLHRRGALLEGVRAAVGRHASPKLQLEKLLITLRGLR